MLPGLLLQKRINSAMEVDKDCATARKLSEFMKLHFEDEVMAEAPVEFKESKLHTIPHVTPKMCGAAFGMVRYYNTKPCSEHSYDRNDTFVCNVFLVEGGGGGQK